MTTNEIGRIEGRLIELLERMASVETTLASMSERRKEDKGEERRYRETLETQNAWRYAKNRDSVADLEDTDKQLLGFSNRVIGGLLVVTLGLSTLAAGVSIFQAIGF